MGPTAAIPADISGPTHCAEQARITAVRARRMRQRRQMLEMIAVSYLIDAAILLLYVYAGTIPMLVVPAYAGCALIVVGGFIAISETGFNDRFKDHYLILPVAAINLAVTIAFTFWMPQIGFQFLCTLFVLFGFASLRSSPRQNLIAWTAMTCALAILFLVADQPVGIPQDSLLERFATMLVLMLAIGRCMFIGMFSSALRESLYRRGVELKAAYRRIEELAELDELTGALNRRCIMRLLDNEIEHAARHDAPLALALIDLDWFKRINDTYGHPTGDEVLRTFAITIFANIRSVDRFGRYGGEEFLLLLPNTSGEEAGVMLERLRIIVAELDWSAFSTGMRVTLSAGATMAAEGESSEVALARADGALYAAKNAGRNRIVIA